MSTRFAQDAVCRSPHASISCVIAPCRHVPMPGAGRRTATACRRAGTRTCSGDVDPRPRLETAPVALIVCAVACPRAAGSIAGRRAREDRENRLGGCCGDRGWERSPPAVAVPPDLPPLGAFQGRQVSFSRSRRRRSVRHRTLRPGAGVPANGTGPAVLRSRTRREPFVGRRSARVTQHRDEVARTAGEHERVPGEVRVTHALVEHEEDDPGDSTRCRISTGGQLCALPDRR